MPRPMNTTASATAQHSPQVRVEAELKRYQADNSGHADRLPRCWFPIIVSPSGSDSSSRSALLAWPLMLSAQRQEQVSHCGSHPRITHRVMSCRYQWRADGPWPWFKSIQWWVLCGQHGIRHYHQSVSLYRLIAVLVRYVFKGDVEEERDDSWLEISKMSHVTKSQSSTTLQPQPRHPQLHATRWLESCTRLAILKGTVETCAAAFESLERQWSTALDLLSLTGNDTILRR